MHKELIHTFGHRCSLLRSPLNPNLHPNFLHAPIFPPSLGEDYPQQHNHVSKSPILPSSPFSRITPRPNISNITSPYLPYPLHSINIRRRSRPRRTRMAGKSSSTNITIQSRPPPHRRKILWPKIRILQ
jgi:hypothetical protein